MSEERFVARLRRVYRPLNVALLALAALSIWAWFRYRSWWFAGLLIVTEIALFGFNRRRMIRRRIPAFFAILVGTDLLLVVFYLGSKG